jgi:FHS family Na+ dependent glucose MFS transporter 1
MQYETKQTHSKKPFSYFIAYGLCFLSLGLAGVSLGPLLPSLSEVTGTSLAQISFIFSARSLGYLIGAGGAGHFYDRVNGHKLMIFCLSLMVAGHFLIPLFPTYIIILIAMFIIGLGHAAIDIGGNVNLLWIYQSKVGPYMNAMHFCFGVGALFSPILIQNLMGITNDGLTWPFWVLAFSFLPGIFSLFFLKAPQNPEKDHTSTNSGRANTWLIALMMFLLFLYVGIEGGFGGWIYTYVTNGEIASETAASYMNSLFWGALTFGRLISIPLARKINPSKLLLGNFGAAILSLTLILLWPNDKIIVWVVSAGFGLSLSSVFPTLMAMGETRMKVTGKVTSLFFIGASFGGLLMPMLLGQIFDYVGSYYVMAALFAATFLGLMVLLSVLFVSKKVGEKQRI